MLGKALCEELLPASETEVVGLSSRDVDLTDYSATLDCFTRLRPTTVYHLAARVAGIMGNLRAQGQGYFDNVRMNTNVVEAARLSGASKVVAMGSAAIYSDSIKLPMNEDDIWSGPPHPAEAGYAHAKRGMLAHLEAYRDQYGLDYAYCVSSNLFGPHDKFDEQHGHVIPSLLSKFHRALRDGGAVTVWGSGTPMRDFLYVKDAARAVRMVGERFTGAINLASGHPMSIQTTVDLIRNVSRFAGELYWDRSKPDGQLLRDYDVSRLRSIGFEPAYDLRQGLQETFEWLVRNEATVRR